MSRRIVIHDYGGYHFPGELGQALAARGDQVLHLYFTQCLNPPAVGGRAAHPNYQLRGLSISGEFQKYSFVKRRQQEIEYGHVAARAILDFQPDLVISSTTPTDAQAVIQKACAKAKIPFVFWLQDIISVGMKKILPKKIPVLGRWIGAFYEWQEARILRNSDAVIAISDHFLPVCRQMRVESDRCAVIENWAPLDEIQPVAKPTAWAVEQGLADKKVILYSGTLGFKHNPSIFEHLSQHFRQRGDVRIVVITEGIGGSWLQERKQALGLDNLILLPYQPYGRLSEVLATGDVVMAILEEDAGIFSVPSKVLSYLSAGRPILLSVPLDNLAADTVRRAGAGRVVAPRDLNGLVQAAEAMLADPDERDRSAAQGRRYAEETFDIGKICDRFNAVFQKIARH